MDSLHISRNPFAVISDKSSTFIHILIFINMTVLANIRRQGPFSGPQELERSSSVLSIKNFIGNA